MGFARRTLGRSDSRATSEDTCWVFDVDGCLVDSLLGTSLRPGARELLVHLAARRGPVLLWSAGGQDYAEHRAAQFGLEIIVNGCFAKGDRDELGFYRTTHLALGSGPTVYVDDRPEDLSPGLNVMAVRPYLTDDPHDRGLEEVARQVGLTSSDDSGRRRESS
jgi:long-chain acyl-CoA synthetase